MRYTFQTEGEGQVKFKCSVELGSEASETVRDGLRHLYEGLCANAVNTAGIPPTVEEFFDVPAFQAAILELFGRNCGPAIQEAINHQFIQAQLLTTIDALNFARPGNSPGLRTKTIKMLADKKAEKERLRLGVRKGPKAETRPELIHRCSQAIKRSGNTGYMNQTQLARAMGCEPGYLSRRREIHGIKTHRELFNLASSLLS